MIPAPPDVAAPPEDATKTRSGLAYKVLSGEPGGKKPGPTDRVTVHYSGWTTDGKLFDSSRSRGQPASFGLNEVIPGWTEGLQLMATGQSVRFWIPMALAYRGQPGRPYGLLVFDVDLLNVAEVREPPAVPSDVAAPPADARRTATGLRYKVIKEGDGGRKPTARSAVTCDYTGWTTDGKCFDSSIPRGAPSSFPLNRVIKGWTEGLQLMSKGAIFRFWIPKELAYNNQPGRPMGTLVFDIELHNFR
ncbi:MAG: FKBP-type peptidyl-prolyl cis-trans isomerase [Myxococcota bacterium]|jgi:FKBP-type peptidyl-prolyl cis-trans isomerase